MNKHFSEQIKKIKKDSVRLKKSSKKIEENKNFYIETNNIYFDYSKNIIDKKSIKNLLDLANIADVRGNYKKLIRGEIVNKSENRMAIHSALRNTKHLLDKNIVKDINDHKRLIKKLSDDIYKGKRKSCCNKKYTDIVSVGTGGSFFGIKAIYESLKNYSSNNIQLHFISNLDFTENKDLLSKLDPKKPCQFPSLKFKLPSFPSVRVFAPSLL